MEDAEEVLDLLVRERRVGAVETRAADTVERAATRKDAERRARLPVEDRRDLPTGHEAIRDVVLEIPVLLPVADRQFINDVCLERVRDVVFGAGARLVRVVDVERRLELRLAETRRVREHLRPGVVGLEAETVREATADFSLERVVVGRADVLDHVRNEDARVRREADRAFEAVRDVDLRKRTGFRSLDESLDRAVREQSAARE